MRRGQHAGGPGTREGGTAMLLSAFGPGDPAKGSIVKGESHLPSSISWPSRMTLGPNQPYLLLYYFTALTPTSKLAIPSVCPITAHDVLDCKNSRSRFAICMLGRLVPSLFPPGWSTVSDILYVNSLLSLKTGVC